MSTRSVWVFKSDAIYLLSFFFFFNIYIVHCFQALRHSYFKVGQNLGIKPQQPVPHQYARRQSIRQEPVVPSSIMTQSQRKTSVVAKPALPNNVANEKSDKVSDNDFIRLIARVHLSGHF